MKKPKRRQAVPGLDRDRIARAALARIDAGGLASLSMRALAADLGCEAMSLYHHVDGVDGVHDGVVDRLFDAILRGAAAGEAPRKSLGALAAAYLAVAEAHPRAFPLLATRLLHTPRAIAAVGRTLELLRALGHEPQAARRQARILAAYLNGAGLALAAWKLAPDGGRRSARAAEKRADLAPLRDAVRGDSVRADLEAGLARLLDGL